MKIPAQEGNQKKQSQAQANDSVNQQSGIEGSAQLKQAADFQDMANQSPIAAKAAYWHDVANQHEPDQQITVSNTQSAPLQRKPVDNPYQLKSNSPIQMAANMDEIKKQQDETEGPSEIIGTSDINMGITMPEDGGAGAAPSPKKKIED